MNNLTRDELKTLIEWYNAIKDLNPDHLQEKDVELSNKIQKHIDFLDAPTTKPTLVNKEILEKILEDADTQQNNYKNKQLLVTYELKSGFTITGRAGVVDPDNYVHEIGLAICRDDALQQLFMLEGYVLQLKLAKLITDHRD